MNGHVRGGRRQLAGGMGRSWQRLRPWECGREVANGLPSQIALVVLSFIVAASCGREEVAPAAVGW